MRGLVRAALIAALLGGCSPAGGTLLHPHGVVADAQRGWLLIILLLMLLVVLPIFVMVPLFAWRYRRRGGRGAYRPDWTFSWPLEYLIWGIPIVIVAAMATLIITRETALDPYHPIAGDQAALDVDVVALDWKFLFIYPQLHVASVSLLAMPQGRPVRFHLTSDATMQSFFIPALGSQIYAMAGMVTELNLRADIPGALEGENTQFNGDDFQNDRFRVEVLPTADFDRFVTDCRADARILDANSYAILARRTNTVQTRRDLGLPADAKLDFGDVQPGLFESIVAKYHPGGMAMTMPQNSVVR